MSDPVASDPPAPHPLDRIHDALARIEAAVAARDAAAGSMEDRHAALRARIEEAVAALDGMLAKER